MNMEIFLTVASAGFSGAALFAAITAFQSARRWQTRCEALEVSVAAVRRELELAASISVRTVRRVQRVEQEFSGVTERVDLAVSRTANGTDSLDHAIDLARRGAGSDRLEQQFGLSTGEADLVARLHGRTRAH